MILVTGATGNIGRHVVSQLVENGVAVRALARNSGKIDLLPDGVEFVPADLSEPATLLPALKDVKSVFLFPVPGCGPGFVKAAQASGVGRVVLLSSGAVRDDVEQQTNVIGAIHADIEEAIQKSELEWIIIRPGSLAVNALQWAPQISGAGVVYGPYAQAASAPVHEADVAALAVQALTDRDHAGARYLVTGPESLTRTDEVRIIGNVIGQELSYVEIPPEAARQMMVQFLPEAMADALLGTWAQAVGHPAQVRPTVEDITGRPALAFHQWATDHAADFR